MLVAQSSRPPGEREIGVYLGVLGSHLIVGCWRYVLASGHRRAFASCQVSLGSHVNGRRKLGDLSSTPVVPPSWFVTAAAESPHTVTRTIAGRALRGPRVETVKMPNILV